MDEEEACADSDEARRHHEAKGYQKHVTQIHTEAKNVHATEVGVHGQVNDTVQKHVQT